MSYQIEKTNDQLSKMKENFDLIIAEIKSTEDVNFISETIDKVKLAREWAKLQKKTEDMYSDLLRIEIECFKRIYQLNCINVLHPNKRKLAQFFGEMTVSEIEKLLKEKYGCSAYKIFRDYTYDYDMARWKNRGVSLAKNDISRNEEDFINENIDDNSIKYNLKKIAKYKENALSFIVDHYASNGEPFTIEEMADNLLLEVADEVDFDITKEMKRGIREVCRGAVMSAKTLFFKDTKMPRFVTCSLKMNRSGNEWIRIPFENATLSQFSEMIELRKEQIKQDQNALDNLIEIYNHVLNNSKNIKDFNMDKTKISQIVNFSEVKQ